MKSSSNKTTTNLQYRSKVILEEMDSIGDSSEAKSEDGEPGDQTFRKNPDYKLNVQGRGALNTYFNAWIDHHLLQKRLWKKMIKTRCHLKNLRLNRFLIGWKNQIRILKVQKVKVAICTHSIYKRKMLNIFKNWKVYAKMKKIGAQMLNNLFNKTHKKLFVTYL